MDRQYPWKPSRSRSHSPRAHSERNRTGLTFSPSPLGFKERERAQASGLNPFGNSAYPNEFKHFPQPLKTKQEPPPIIHLQRTATIKTPSPANSTVVSEDDEDLWHLHSYHAPAPPRLHRIIPKFQRQSSDELTDLFPKTILCELYVTFNSPRKIATTSDNCKQIFEAFDWSDESSYEIIREQCNRTIERFKSNAHLVKPKIYLRYGICSVKGPNDETSFSPDTSLFNDDNLHETAIKEVCRFIAEHTYQKIKLVVRCDYGSLQDHDDNSSESSESSESSGPFSALMIDQYDHKLKIPAKNLLGQQYISRADLNQLTSKEISEKLIDEEYRGSDQQREELKQIMNKKPAQTLLAVCIYERIPLYLFKHFLVHHNYWDANLGQIASDIKSKQSSAEQSSEARCSMRSCDHDRDRLHNGMHKFFAHWIMQDRLFNYRGEHEVIPVSYAGQDKEESYLGGGAFSQVYEVCIDVTHRFGTFKSGLAETYALKVFKNDIKEERRQMAFRREMRALLHLALFPHDHILTHITSWEQRDNFYILYDKAESNLSDYMKKHKGGKLTGSRILWFVGQLRGLADAVRRIHHFKDPSSMDFQRFLKPQKSRKTGVVGYHHDIKPDNILVFGTPERHPVLKLSDFGAGKFSKVRKFQESGEATKDAHGTVSYFGPEYPLKIDMSRPFDMWALGCVFLEFLLWFLDLKRPLDNKTFSELRIDMSGNSNPGVIDYYWAHKNLSSSSVWGTKGTLTPDSDDEDDSLQAKTGKSNLLAATDHLDHKFDAFELNKAVQKVLQKLEQEWCVGMWLFQRILKQIRRLLEIRPKLRLSAATLADKLDSYLAQTNVDLEKNSIHDESFAMDNENNLYAKQFQENKEHISARESGQPTKRRNSNPGLRFLSTPMDLPIADAPSADESSNGSSRKRSMEFERDAEMALGAPDISDTDNAAHTVGTGSHLHADANASQRGDIDMNTGEQA